MRTNALLEITSAHNFAETAKEVITVNATRDTESELIGSLVKVNERKIFQIPLLLSFKTSWCIQFPAVKGETVIFKEHETMILSMNISDENECKLPKSFHHCQQTCVNTPGSYYCMCEDGFRLSANGRSCRGKIVSQELIGWSVELLLSRHPAQEWNVIFSCSIAP